MFLSKLKKFFFLNKLPSGVEFGFLKKIIPIDQLCGLDSKKVDKNFSTVTDTKASQEFGTENLKEFSFWAPRSCGIAVATSILKSTGFEPPTLYKTVKKLDGNNGYIHKNDIGWKHQSIVDFLGEYNVQANIVRKISITSLLKEILKKNIFIASVKSKREGSHMVLFYKFIKHTDGSIELFFMDPWNFKNTGGLISKSLEEFEAEFLNRGILVYTKDI